MVTTDVFTVRIALFNIRQTPPMRQASVIHDLREARKTHAQVIVWNELIKYRRYRQALRAVFPRRQGYRHTFLDQRNATTVDLADVSIIGRVPHKLTDGARWLPQPPRYANQLILRDFVSDEVFDVYNLQFTNGGYNGRWRPKFNRNARKRLWDTQFEKTKRHVRHTVDIKGRVAIIAGDTNRVKMPQFHERQVVLAEYGLMKIYGVAPEGYDITVLRRKVISETQLKTDHPGLWVAVRIKEHHEQDD